jgi:hypothetical protein
VDWIILVYYSIALAYLPSKIRSSFPSSVPAQTAPQENLSWNTSRSDAILFFTLLLVAVSIPITERLIHAHGYEGFSENAKIEVSDQSGISLQEINVFLQQKDAVLVSGMALYPRYIRPGVNIYLAGAPSGYKYLHFWLMNETDNQIVLPLETIPTDIPHTAIVSVLGCRQDAYISAYAVIVQQPAKKILTRTPTVFPRCPLPTPH